MDFINLLETKIKKKIKKFKPQIFGFFSLLNYLVYGKKKLTVDPSHKKDDLANIDVRSVMRVLFTYTPDIRACHHLAVTVSDFVIRILQIHLQYTVQPSCPIIQVHACKKPVCM